MTKSMKDRKFFGQNRAAVCDGGFGESKFERKIKICLLLRSDLEKISVQRTFVSDQWLTPRSSASCFSE